MLEFWRIVKDFNSRVRPTCNLSLIARIYHSYDYTAPHDRRIPRIKFLRRAIDLFLRTLPWFGTYIATNTHRR